MPNERSSSACGVLSGTPARSLQVNEAFERGAEPAAACGGFYLIRQAGACHLSCFASVSLIIVVQLRLSLVGLCDSARFRFAVSATGGAHLRAQGGRQRKRAEHWNCRARSVRDGKLQDAKLAELSTSLMWVTVPMQERGAEAPAVRGAARRKRDEQRSDQAAVQITTIVSLTEATEGSKKCPVKAS